MTDNGCDKCRAAIPYYLEQFQDLFVKDSPSDHEPILMPQLYGGRLDLTFLQMITGLLEQKQIQHVELTENKRIRLIGISQEADHIVKEHGHIMPQESKRLSHVLSCDCRHDPSVTTLVMEIERQLKTRFYLQSHRFISLVLPAYVISAPSMTSASRSSWMNGHLYRRQHTST